MSLPTLNELKQIGIMKEKGMFFTDEQKELLKEIDLIENRNRFIKHMGECIFPQPFHELDKLFDLEVMVSSAKDGLIQTSEAQVGLSPSSMKPLKRYVELSDKGWEKYEELKQKTK